MIKAYHKLLRNYRDNGLSITLNKILFSLIGSIYMNKAYRIYRKNIADSGIEKGALSGEFVFRLLEIHEDDLIGQIESMEEWLAGMAREKLQAGSICVVALDGNKVAGFNMISFGRVHMPIVHLDRIFRAHEAWSDQITVNKRYRGKGLATDLRLEAFRFLADRGVKKFYGGTLPTNMPNRKLSRKVGFRELGDIRYRKLLMKQKWSFERAADEIS